MKSQISVVPRWWRVALTSLVFAVVCVGCGRASMETTASAPQAMVAPAPPAESPGTSYLTADSAEPGPAEVRNQRANYGPKAAMDFAAMPSAKGGGVSSGVSRSHSALAAKDTAEPDENAPKPEKAPLLIYKAEVALAVFEVNKGLDAVEKIAREAQGYLVSRRDDTIVIRVPAAGFDGSLKAILELGDVLKRDLQVEDVTAQMNDLTTRLKNAEAIRGRLEQLLTTAKTTEEALKVEQELGRVTGEIESIKGKLRLMSELVSFSTITVNFRPAVSEQVNSKFKLPFPWLEELGLSRLLSL